MDVLNYGNVLAKGEQIKGARTKNQMLGANQQLENTKMLYSGLMQIATSPESAEQVVPQLQQAGIMRQDFDYSQMSMDERASMAAEGAKGLKANLDAYKSSEYKPQDATSFQRDWNTFNSATTNDQERMLGFKRASPWLNEGNQFAQPSQLPGGKTRTRDINLKKSEEIPYKVGVAEQTRLAILGADLEIQPQITTATETAKATVKEKVEKKRLSKAYKTYEVASGNLRKALEATVTGFIAGRLPAATASAQIAENAKAIMLPVLKGIVRGAGEGVFTDADAIAVMALLPDRINSIDALDGIFKNMDDFLRSKLQIGPKNGGNPQVDPSLLEFMTPEERALFE